MASPSPAGAQQSTGTTRIHGLTARHLAIAADAHTDFDSLRDALINEIQPQGEAERLQVDLILHAAWNLRRLRRREASLMSGNRDPLLDPAVQKDVDRLALHQARAERSYYRALREIRALQTSRAIHVNLYGPRQAVTPIRVDAAAVHRHTRDNDERRALMGCLGVRPPLPGQSRDPVEELMDNEAWRLYHQQQDQAASRR